LGKEIIFSEMPDEELDYIDLLSKGITSIIFPNATINQISQSKYPIRFLAEADTLKREFKLLGLAEFLLVKNNIVRFAFVNGNLFDLKNDFWLTN